MTAPRVVVGSAGFVLCVSAATACFAAAPAGAAGREGTTGQAPATRSNTAHPASMPREAVSGGEVQAYGGAQTFGSLAGTQPAAPVVGMAATPDGGGYWLVASDGGVFTFGDASFYGSAGDVHLNAPVVSMAATPDGGGYWLVASDGGVFTYGDAAFYGSAAGTALTQPVMGIVADPGGGYWLYEGVRPVSFVDLFNPALTAGLNQRAGTVSAAVLDLDTGSLYQYQPGV